MSVVTKAEKSLHLVQKTEAAASIQTTSEQEVPVHKIDDTVTSHAKQRRYKCPYHRDQEERRQKEQAYTMKSNWHRVKSNFLTVLNPETKYNPNVKAKTSVNTTLDRIRQLNREIRVLRQITREKLTEQQLLVRTLRQTRPSRRDDTSVGQISHKTSFIKEKFLRTYNKLSRGKQKSTTNFVLPTLPSVQELQENTSRGKELQEPVLPILQELHRCPSLEELQEEEIMLTTPGEWDLPHLPDIEGDQQVRTKASCVVNEVKSWMKIYKRNEAVEPKKSFAWWFLHQKWKKAC